ncbi:MAG: hypothetical protein MRY75_11955 [Marivita sp.]|uniref:hypothetical protein n=1 Tax=Marivita sp. TaxID=2003365 RepID=UPI0025C10E98|nr:hypothetical protein [Marivita sp.]MCI5111257.1 hypothetical protein [Marivita sp.]
MAAARTMRRATGSIRLINGKTETARHPSRVARWSDVQAKHQGKAVQEDTIDTPQNASFATILDDLSWNSALSAHLERRNFAFAVGLSTSGLCAFE